jgi:hypothetical protein
MAYDDVEKYEKPDMSEEDFRRWMEEGAEPTKPVENNGLPPYMKRVRTMREAPPMPAYMREI